jgi:hypothetical protein
MAAIEIFSVIGATATTITCSYTNQAGTSGRTSLPVAIGGGTHGSAASRFILLSLQEGDSGVRSVESSTLLASTLTAGAFGYVLFRPLVTIPFFQGLTTDFHALLGGSGQFDEIVDDACLFWIWFGASSPGGIQGQFTLIEA